MFSQKVIVWGGIASAFGSLMWIFGVKVGGEFTLPLASLLMLGGLAALHTRQGKQAGALGWMGFALGIFGTGLLILSFLFFMQDTAPGLQFDLGMSILGIGSILMGLRMLQTGILPRSSAMLSLVIGVSQIGFGFCVWLMYSRIPGTL